MIKVDVNGLQQQMDEKRLREMEEAAEARAQEERSQYITMLMEQQAAEDREMKRRELKDLRGTWEYQSNLPKNNAMRMGEPVDPANCGVAAVQKFRGEVK
jgi:SOS-response transcriptional repressor LexA